MLINISMAMAFNALNDFVDSSDKSANYGVSIKITNKNLYLKVYSNSEHEYKFNQVVRNYRREYRKDKLVEVINGFVNCLEQCNKA